MKSAIILNVLAVIFLFGIADASEDASVDLPNQDWKAVSDVELFYDKLVLESTSTDEMFEQAILERISERPTEYLFKYLSENTTVNDANKTIDSCIKKIEQTIGKNVAEEQIENCGKIARKFHLFVVRAIGVSEDSSDKNLIELQRIITNCDSLDGVKLEECINNEHSEPRNSDDMLDVEESNVKRIYLALQEQRTECLKDVMETIDDNIRSVDVYLSQCVKSLALEKAE